MTMIPPIGSIPGVGEGVSAAAWKIPSLPGLDGAPVGGDGAPKVGGGQGAGFGDLLTRALDGVNDKQVEAAQASRDLALGTADPTKAVVALEQAKLTMQFAATVRTKTVEAIQDIFRTQI